MVWFTRLAQMLMDGSYDRIWLTHMDCELTLECGAVSASVVMNELRRLIAPHLPTVVNNVPDGIALTMEAIANCHRYDYLLGAANVH